MKQNLRNCFFTVNIMFGNIIIVKCLVKIHVITYPKKSSKSFKVSKIMYYLIIIFIKINIIDFLLIVLRLRLLILFAYAENFRYLIQIPLATNKYNMQMKKVILSFYS